MLMFSVGCLSLITAITYSTPFIDIIAKRVVDAPFLHNKIVLGGQKQVVLFFGFEHCRDVCPATLTVLRDFVKENRSDSNRLDSTAVIFIDIDRNSSQLAAERYTSRFDSNIVAYFPSPQELDILKDQFSLNIYQDHAGISHVGRVYLIEKISTKWWIKKSYSPIELTADEILKDLDKMSLVEV